MNQKITANTKKANTFSQNEKKYHITPENYRYLHLPEYLQKTICRFVKFHRSYSYFSTTDKPQAIFKLTKFWDDEIFSKATKICGTLA